ncbi:uncharacterized protein LOC111780320 isoform X1 [Cucurbita pepo subsp. pepo]|uniref:uncharacterized protein LOC111780320 isoform X1 n=1 Tax=Cucurbita pepo subsp. pepo TaxID=3664 RepID=UPI000C9D4CA8|nr:uncharacterized protein LOC111780320 isoform X1 [Cucurbita pepo subsp. pepo]
MNNLNTMGKRKPGSDQTHHDRPHHLSGIVPFSNQMDVRSEEQDRSLARPIFMKRSRHQYSHQYCRRGSTSQANASTSRENRVRTILEKRPAFKFAAHCNSEFPYHIESNESTFLRPERIRYNSLGKDTILSHGRKIVCGICQKLMRRKLCFLGNTLSSSELPVAAVLVCGHVYHADCLENGSNIEDRSDPRCPLCMEPPAKVDDSTEQE